MLLPFQSALPSEVEERVHSLIEKDYGVSLGKLVEIVCLRPVSKINLEWTGRLAEELARQPNDLSQHWLTLGMVELRRGQHDRAVSLMEAAIPRLRRIHGAKAYAVLAMAKTHLERHDEARQAFHAGRVLLDVDVLTGPRLALEREPCDWLVAHLLLREADGMIGGGTAGRHGVDPPNPGATTETARPR